MSKKSTPATPPMPECERLIAVASESQTIGAFLDWAQQKQKDVMNTRIEPLLAEYFEIDLNKVEEERRALMEWLRKQNE